MTAETQGPQQWGVRIDGALQAHFKQENGPSRPGTDFALSLKQGDTEHRIMVRAYLADDMSAAARQDLHYQGQTVIGYVFDRLGAGWAPGDGPLPPLTILNPGPDCTPPPPLSLWERLTGFFGR